MSNEIQNDITENKECIVFLNPMEYEDDFGKDKFVCIRLEPGVIKQIKIACCINVGFILSGYSIGWSAPVLGKLQSVDSPLKAPLTPEEASWVTTMVFVGSMIGLLCASYVSHRFGRKFCLKYTTMITLIGYILTLVGKSIVVLYVGRLLCGLGLGPLLVTSLVYVGEVASPEGRGIIMSFAAITYILGSILAYCVGPYVSYAVVGYIGVILSVTHIACGFYLPESPVYFTIKGRITEAKRSLHELGRTKDIDTELKTMIDDLKQHQLPNDDKSTSYFDLITVKKHRKAFLITLALAVGMHVSGATTIVVYATTIFENAHSSVKPEICTIILGFTELLGISVTPFVIERYGRKVMLLVSSAGCSFSMLVLGAYFYLNHIHHPLSEHLRVLPLVMLITFLLFFNFGLGVVPNTLIGEMFGTTVRDIGSSITNAIAFSASFISILGFSYIVMIFGSHIAFWIYAGINAATFIFTFTFVKETRGKSLMEIQALLN